MIHHPGQASPQQQPLPSTDERPEKEEGQIRIEHLLPLNPEIKSPTKRVIRRNRRRPRINATGTDKNAKPIHPA
jgi:hypothetical protein